MKNVLKTYLFITLAVIFCYFLGIIFLGNTLDIPTDTETFYSPVAVSLVEGKGYTLNGDFSFRYPPLFPIFLALIYKWASQAGTENIFYPYVVSILQSFSCGFLYLIAYPILGSRGAVVAALLLATHPLFVVLAVTKYAWNAMPLFGFLFFASVVIFLGAIKKHSLFLTFCAAFLLGLSNLAWPGAIGLGVLFLGYTIIRFYKTTESRKKLKFVAKAALLFFLGLTIPVGGWGFYVFRQTGQKILLSSAGMPGILDGLIRNEGSNFRSFEVSNDAQLKQSEGTLNSFTDVFNFYAEELIEKPGQTLRFIFFKLGRGWYGTDSEKYEKWILFIQMPYLLLGLYGILTSLRQKLPYIGFILIVIIYFWLVSFSVLSIVRYMIPALGLLMIFVAYALENIEAKLKTTR